MKENNQGKEILKILQENYDIKSAKDLSGALKDMFKGALQEMMIYLGTYYSFSKVLK